MAHSLSRDGMLDFGEFALAASGQETAGADCRERLVWMFDRLYDQVTDTSPLDTVWMWTPDISTRYAPCIEC